MRIISAIVQPAKVRFPATVPGHDDSGHTAALAFPSDPAFRGVTFASHFLFPSVRWFFRRRLERGRAAQQRLTGRSSPSSSPAAMT
jgi:hypothetical protein